MTSQCIVMDYHSDALTCHSKRELPASQGTLFGLAICNVLVRGTQREPIFSDLIRLNIGYVSVGQFFQAQD